MATRARSRSRAALAAISLVSALSVACGVAASSGDETAAMAPVDVSGVPSVTTDAASPDLVLDNGVYRLRGAPYSGVIEERYPNGVVKRAGSYYEGRQHGITKTFYADGRLRDERSYRDNLSYGRHVGYWDNGNIKFDFIYRDEKREGLHRQWYRTGAQYTALNYRDDKEHGMQRAWRDNGKPYINYEARNGFRYGLQKSALCYELADGAVK